MWLPGLLSAFVALPVALADPGSNCAFGADVAPDDPNWGQSVHALPLGRVAFIDDDGDSLYDSGETLYLDLDESGDVSAADVLLSGSGAGSRPTVGGPGFNAPLTTFSSPALSFLDSDGTATRGTGEAILLERSPSGMLGVGDHYLAPASRAGRPHTAGEGGTNSALAPLAGSFAFVDADADGAPDIDEHVVIDTDGDGTLGLADVCMTSGGSSPPPPGDCAFGGQVPAGHPNAGAQLSSLPLNLVAFIDGDGDGVYDSSESLYVDADRSMKVSAADVRLSGVEAGTRSAAGSSDYNAFLTTFPDPALSFLDSDGTATRGTGEAILLERSPSGMLGVGDHYLAPASRAGRPHTAGEGGTNSALAPLAGSLAVVDHDQDGFADGDEPVFLDVDGNHVLGVSDVCIGEAATPTPGPGTSCILGRAIRMTDVAWGKAAIQLPRERVRYLDADSDGTLDETEQVYLDVDASGTVSAADVRWSAGPGAIPAGSRVSSADSDVGAALADLHSHDFGFVNTDADLDQATSDFLVLDADGILGRGDRYLAPQDRAGRTQARVAAGSTLVALESNVVVGFVDDDGDGTPDATEEIVGVLGEPGKVSTADICLWGPNPASLEGPVGLLESALPMAGSGSGGPASGPRASRSGFENLMESLADSWVVEFGAAHQTTIMLGTAGVALVILGWRLRVPSRLLLLLPLYSKLERESLLENPARRRILALVEAQPGVRYQQVVRALGRGHGLVDSHLCRLVQAKLVRAHRAAGRVHYFLPRDATSDRLARYTSASGPTAQRVLEQVENNSPISSGALAAQLGLARSTVHAHVSRLTRAGLVLSAREGRQTYFRAAQAAAGPSPAPTIPRIPPRSSDLDS